MKTKLVFRKEKYVDFQIKAGNEDIVLLELLNDKEKWFELLDGKEIIPKGSYQHPFDDNIMIHQVLWNEENNISSNAKFYAHIQSNWCDEVLDA